MAGTILGGGIYDPDGIGPAPGADLVYSSYPANFTSVDQDYVNYNVRITTSSFEWVQRRLYEYHSAGGQRCSAESQTDACLFCWKLGV